MVYSLPWDRLLNSGSCINYGFSWQSQKPPQWFTILGQKLVVIKQFWIGCCWFATWEKQGGVISAHRHLEQRWAKRLPGRTMGTLHLGSQTFPSPQTCVRYSRMHHIHGFKIVHLHSHISQPFNQGPSSIHLAPAFPTMRCVPGATTRAREKKSGTPGGAISARTGSWVKGTRSGSCAARRKE